MLKAAKNELGTIIAIGPDQGQSGRYPAEEFGEQMGEWCSWVFEAVPAYEEIPGHERALYFKENEAGDGIEVRTQEEIELSPNE